MLVFGYCLVTAQYLPRLKLKYLFRKNVCFVTSTKSLHYITFPFPGICGWWMRNEFTQYITLLKHNAQLKWNRLLLNQVCSFANAITCILPQLFSNFKSSRDRAEIPQWCTSRPLTSFFISCTAVVSLKGTLVEHLLTSAVAVELETFVCHHSLIQLVPFTLPCVARFLVAFWFL